MNPQPTDPQLQQLFAEQRALDQARTPSFARLCPGSPGRPARAVWPWALAAATTVVLVVVASWRWREQAVPALPAPMVVASITDWAAPTDVLLEWPTPNVPGTQP
jgi:hypothetical protein